MARRLLLEGSNIDELLARVRADHGPDVEIVHAQERLVGGVGGFFARRRYEVAIEVKDDLGPGDRVQDGLVQDGLVRDGLVRDGLVRDELVQDDETGAGAGRLGQEQTMNSQGFAGGSPIGGTIYDALQDALRGDPAPASSFEDLLSVADRQDGAGTGRAPASVSGSVPASVSGSVPAAAAVASQADAASAEDTVFRPAPYVPAAALAGKSDVAEPAPPHRPVSTETPGFEALLRDLMHQRDLALEGMQAAPATATEPAPAPVSAALGSVSARAGNHRPWSVPAGADVAGDVPAAPHVPPVADVPSSTTVPVVGHVPAAPVVPAAPAVPAAADLADVRPDVRFDVPAPEPTSAPAGDGDELPTRRRASHRRSGPATTAPQALVDLGLSPDSPVRAASPDPRTVLLDLLTEVATSAPTDLRGTAVLVGPVGPARAVARRLLTETGLPRQCLLVVDLEDEEFVVADVLMAAAERCGRHGAAVVVLATGSARQDGRAAGRLAALLGSGPLTAVVDATRDAEATRSWLQALGEGGRRVDDLAAFDVTMTSLPLRLLELGHRVSWLDAVPATLGAWAAPCLERLRA